jgi:hypothetical protein
MGDLVHIVVASLLLGACASSPPRTNIQLTPAEELCPSAERGEICMPVDKIEHLLKEGELSVRQVRKTSHGTSGAVVMWLEFPRDQVTLKAKWKQAARGGWSPNNEPRKELAAYALQKLFLDPEDYVVPPTVSRCIPLDFYRVAVRARATPTFRGTDCAFGVFAFWLEGVQELSSIDGARFESDILYRKTIANLNVFTYLFDHRDTRPSNFAVASNRDFPRAFAVDNGLALDGLTNPRVTGAREWRHIVVNKIPARLVERLRKITRADLDTLATVAELTIDGQQMDPTNHTVAFEEDSGVRRRGNVIQLGLTKREIDDIQDRLRSLLARIDAGKLEQY